MTDPTIEHMATLLRLRAATLGTAIPARNWLSSTEVGRRVVRWYGIDQVVFGENEYGTQRWRR